jgi:RNA polymerase sigma-70 factor (ECF subfamily)
MALVTAAESGRNQAFEVLLGRYHRRILRVALRFARIREDAEDFVQQTFQKVSVHLQQFQGDSSFSTWITRIAINEALNWLRVKCARPEVAIEELSPTSQGGQRL